MNALKISVTLLAVMLTAQLQTSEAQGQSIAQRRLHPGTCCRRSTRVVQPRVRYYAAPRATQPQQSAQSYRSFSFEPGEGNEESSQQQSQVIETPVYRPARTRHYVPSYLKSPVHRRLHPGTN